MSPRRQRVRRLLECKYKRKTSNVRVTWQSGALEKTLLLWKKKQKYCVRACGLVCVVSVIRHAKRTRRIILPSVTRQAHFRGHFYCLSASFSDEDHRMWRSERLPDTPVGDKFPSDHEPAPPYRERSVSQLIRHDECRVSEASFTSLCNA
jgi:hypothetical protein